MRKLTIFRLIPVFAALILTMLATVAANLKITAIDVGQGDSILIETPGNKNILVDAGNAGKKGTSSDVIKYLNKQGITKIDLLVLTHPDTDHFGGMKEVVDKISVANYWSNNFNPATDKSTYMKLKKDIVDRKIPSTNVVGGQQYEVGGLKISVLAPVSAKEKTNNNSIIMLMTYEQNSFLLLGDGEYIERKTIKTWQNVDVLKVSHHGSVLGSCDSKIDNKYTFLKTISPKYAVISYGLGNEHAHPTPEALNALSSIKDIKIYGTGANGNVTFTSDGKIVSVVKEKEGAKSHALDRPIPLYLTGESQNT